MLVAFGVIGVVWVGLFTYHLFAPSSSLPFAQRLTPYLFLGFVVLTLVAKLAFTTRQAVRAGVAMFGTVALITATWAVPALMSGVEREVVVRLAAHLAMYAVILVMLIVLARSKDDPLASLLETERLRGFAYVDPVTELPNRRSVEEHVARAVAIAERYSSPLSVAVVDLYPPRGATTSARGWGCADRRPYAAKESGRDRVGGRRFPAVAPWRNTRSRRRS